jgi:hypothetical protein
MLVKTELEQFKTEMFERALTQNARSYINETFDRIRNYIDFDFACMGIADVIITDKKKAELELIQSYPYGTQDKMLSVYAENSHYDLFIPIPLHTSIESISAKFI